MNSAAEKRKAARQGYVLGTTKIGTIKKGYLRPLEGGQFFNLGLKHLPLAINSFTDVSLLFYVSDRGAIAMQRRLLADNPKTADFNPADVITRTRNLLINWSVPGRKPLARQVQLIKSCLRTR